ncbi:transcriptional regulator of the spore photoproduct lyase operon [Amphibacillus marinus]|uniref:Transcriptional regulator of the spore photoproduct lyase operon n=1 Tax=Amphibacillus marinus TaxID=872970 RepID=A0A1H8L5Z6_9BACI|nr:transcriptional regulator SplA domain-containing protein [Amphibacillus marinus]SEO00574.1 transcriptional regulator of the spore photoproduct lyase operon [Amphibacillus marinus]
MINQDYNIGDQVYVMLRNPHVQGAVNVQEAQVVAKPDYPGELALLLNEEYFPLRDDLAVFSDYYEAEIAYRDAFGQSGAEDYHG